MKWLIFFYLIVTVAPLFAAEKSGWQQQWETVLAAAKREGKVTVTGPTGSEVRQALVEPFQKSTELQLNILRPRDGRLLQRSWLNRLRADTFGTCLYTAHLLRWN